MSSKLEQQVAQRLSSSLPTANELLAQRVISLSRSLPTEKAFVNAARAFGRFDESFLLELRSLIASHPDTSTCNGSNGDAAGSSSAYAGEPQPQRAGLATLGGERHIFRTPNAELKQSSLRLDKLTAAKRADANRSNSGNRRQKVSGTQLSHLQDDLDSPAQKAVASEPVFKAPLRPASASHSQIRARGNETPSHPGGLSDTAARRLEEHRRKRAMAADARADASSKGKQVTVAFTSNGATSSVAVGRSKGDSWRASDRNDNGNAYGRDSRDRGTPSSQRLERRTWDSTPRHTPRRTDESDRWTPRYSGSIPRTVPSDPSLASTRSAGSRRWDETPSHHNSSNNRSSPIPKDTTWEDSDDRQLDRDWYDMEESTTLAADSEQDPFSQYSDLKTALSNSTPVPFKQQKLTARQAQYNSDADAWERNRLQTSGVGPRTAIDLDNMDDEGENRVHLLVHDLKPPFLDGKTVFTKQLEPINPVKDGLSDMAVFARKGSRLVRETREKAERAKAAGKVADMGGTALGNILGVKGADDEDDPKSTSAAKNAAKNTAANSITNNDAKVEAEGKGDSQFANHLKSTTGASDFSRTKTLKEQRQYLPAFACRDDLLKIIRENQVVVVIGETGSGKTTQLAQFLHEDGYTQYGLIGCTQPRRVAAMSVAKRVSEEMECKLGGLVGYSIRFEDCTSRDTRIKYMTDGVLLRESLNEGDLDRYSAIILDEAHERSLSTDVLMGLLRKILTRRRDLKLIVTSATMNAERFATFFGGAQTFTIPGRTFPVDVLFCKTPCEDYVDSAVKQALSIHLSHPKGDILIFMTGQEDIEVTCSVISERLAQIDDAPPLLVLPIYSQMPADLQAKIFDASEGGREEMHCRDKHCRDFVDGGWNYLWVLGALNNVGELTALGRKMGEFPMEPSLSKMLITSVEYGCSVEMLTIVSMLSVPTVFYRPKERMEESDAAREKFFVAESDHLTLLHVYNQWRNNGYRDSWCTRHFLHPKTLRKAREVRLQLEDILKAQKLGLISCDTDWDGIRKCITAGYFHQAARSAGIGEYVNCRTGIKMFLHPTSALYGLGYSPEYVVYHQVVLTSKEMMSTVTQVDPNWLAELGGAFYSIKERGNMSGLVRKKREGELDRKTELEEEMRRDKRQKEEEEEVGRRKERESKAGGETPMIATPGATPFRSRRRFM
ncbi:hypothetical protein NDA12_002800 [Ustilago hordei]|nr:hypothetical protein NDA12_002800 [Ustilago hordei]